MDRLPIPFLRRKGTPHAYAKAMRPVEVSLLIVILVPILAIAGEQAAGWPTRVTNTAVILSIAGGLALFLASLTRLGFLHRRVVQAHFRLCPTCGYSLTDLSENGRCPECGDLYRGTEVESQWRDCVKNSNS